MATGAYPKIFDDVNLDNADLSTQVMTSIFGDNWWNLLSAGGDPANGFLFEMLEALNAVCGVVVAWLMILTVLIASTGAAQEGRSLGGRYSSVWVPLRFSFAFAAITPVIKGMCAMQVLLLAAVGVSIDYANIIWERGITWIANGKSVIATPPKINSVGQALAKNAIFGQTLIHYLKTEAGCTNLPSTTDIALHADDGESFLYVFSGVPDTLQCTMGTVVIPKDSLGAFRIKKTGDNNLRDVQVQGIRNLLAVTDPLAQQLATFKPDYSMRAKVKSAGLSYSTAVHSAIENYIMSVENPAKKALQEFADKSKTLGWFTAGTYYWTLATISQQTMDRMSDATEAMPPQPELMAGVIKESWFRNVQPNIMVLLESVSSTSEEDIVADTGRTDNFIDRLGQAFMGFRLLWATKASQSVAEAISGADALEFIVQKARWVANFCEAAMVAVEAGKVVAVGATETVKSSWAKFLDPTGASSGISHAAQVLASDAALLAMICLSVLWTFANFVAWVVPAMPFLIWIAAIVGWIVITLEAIVAAPIWLVGHAMPEGEGFAGQHGRMGYMLLLSTLLRPSLLVISMFLSILILQATGSLIGPLFSPFVNSMVTLGSIGIVGSIFIFVFLAGTVALLTWKTFDLVTAVPDRIIRWIGQQIAPLGNEAAQAQGRDVIGLSTQTAHQTSDAGGKMVADAATRRAPATGGDGSSGGGSNEAPHAPTPVTPKTRRIKPSE